MHLLRTDFQDIIHKVGQILETGNALTVHIVVEIYLTEPILHQTPRGYVPIKFINFIEESKARF